MRFHDQLLLLPPVRPLGERLGMEFFRTVPARPGVYLMCGPGDGVLYVGKAKNLRQRLGQYRSAQSESLPPKLRRLLVRVERIHWDECANEASALARERELLLILRPRFNTVGVYPAPPQRLGWEISSDQVALGLGEGADGLSRNTRPLSRVRSAYAALLRLTWGMVHPKEPLSSMPVRLVNGRAPDRWCERRVQNLPRILDELAALLTEFFAGRSVALIDWFLESQVSESKFEQTWRTQDADRLREFFTRQTTGVSATGLVGLETDR
ncbi:MAG TPA: nucleotide excision repair endonuclease [Verrucomicrobiota bacterium]|nr:hypothetical protein [Verrucomicrobiales bacterium]HRI15689.1 nucleotide excision repair endonuclease [Verrucomicrobiota bacterium]